MVVKKIVNQMWITSRTSTWTSTFAYDNKQTLKLSLLGAAMVLRLRNTWWRELTLKNWTSHLVTTLVGNKRWW